VTRRRRSAGGFPGTGTVSGYNPGMIRLPATLALAVSLLGCATVVKPAAPPVPMTPPPQGAAAEEFRSKGELVWTDLTGASPPRRASFDDWRVSGHKVNLARTPDGTWSGKLGGRDVRLATAPGKVTGPGVELSLTYDDKGAVVVDGLWGGRAVRLVLAKDRISGSTPGGPIDVTDMGTGMFNSYQGLLQISGPPDMPQVVLALLSVVSG
jgi:hypothetical protein